MVTKTKPKKEEPKTLDLTVPGGHIKMVRYIKLEKFRPNPYQPETRIEIAEDVARQFGLSILEHGLLQTPVVRFILGEGDGYYEIGDGWLRLTGFRWLVANGHPEYAKMPCQPMELTDRQMADLVMEANTVRKDLNPIELAGFYKRYLNDFGGTQAELARRHNCSQGEIANTIRLLDLPADIQQKIISQEITETHGRQLLRLNYNTGLQEKALEVSIKEGYSVNQLSAEIARTIYFQSENLDSNDYPKPEFDVKECEKCPNRQKIGQPYSSDKKTWRCLDEKCFKKKTDQAEKSRVDLMQAEIAAAKKETGDKKKDGGVLDLSELGWRDYQELGRNYHRIDNPKECETCPKRALGKTSYRDKTELVCIDVKCFKAKEKAYQDKEAARAREEEKKLTGRVKAACDNRGDEPPPFKLIADYLLSHSLKDTREKFARMYGIPDPAGYFASGDEVNTGQKITALVLTLERYEGEKGRFRKMLADLEGNGAEIDKQIAAFREKHCKTCRHDKVGCKSLMRVYPEGKCYAYWKKDEDEPEDPGEVETLADPGGSLEEDDEQVQPSVVTHEEAVASPTESMVTHEEAIDADSAEAEAEESITVDSADEQKLLFFQVKNCAGCHWADQDKVCTGKPCCTFITTPHIVDGECRTRKVETEANPADPLAELLIQTATDGQKEHRMQLGDIDVRGETLKDCALVLGKHMNWGISIEDILQALNGLPPSNNTRMLIGILEGKNDSA